MPMTLKYKSMWPRARERLSEPGVRRPLEIDL